MQPSTRSTTTAVSDRASSRTSSKTRSRPSSVRRGRYSRDRSSKSTTREGLAKFFRGSGDWPLADSDAVMLGVDTSSTEIADTGWCRAFIDTYESQTAVDVETLLQQTRTANGDYRGTRKNRSRRCSSRSRRPTKVALKRDTDYVTDPTAIGRHVRTKGRPHVAAGSVRRRYSQPQRDSKGRVDGPWPRSRR